MVWLILIAFASGIVGGMGMGGGTLMVPLLSLLDIEQVTVQGINLVSFVPMCGVALLVHRRGGRVCTHNIWYILLPAVLSAVVGCYIAHRIAGNVLRVMYGVMLVAVGVWQLIVALTTKAKRRYIVVQCSNGALRARVARCRR